MSQPKTYDIPEDTYRADQWIWNHRMAKKGNEPRHDSMSVRHLRKHLKEASELLKKYERGFAEEQLESVLLAHGLLYDIHRHLPPVQAWCVMRHSRPESSNFPPTVWYACTTEGQALAICKLLAERETLRYRRNPSRWWVEFGTTEISDMVEPCAAPWYVVRGSFT